MVEEREEVMKVKGIKLTMKNGQIKALDLEINSLKNSLNNKEIECKTLEDEKKKLQENLKALQDAGIKKYVDMKIIA